MNTPQDLLATLEYAHPHIAVRVEALWGMPECDQYLEHILFSDIPDREGFSSPVAAALMALQELHRKLFPIENRDIWRNHAG